MTSNRSEFYSLSDYGVIDIYDGAGDVARTNSVTISRSTYHTAKRRRAVSSVATGEILDAMPSGRLDTPGIIRL
jgi:hypothetical protein